MVIYDEKNKTLYLPENDDYTYEWENAYKRGYRRGYHDAYQEGYDDGHAEVLSE